VRGCIADAFLSDRRVAVLLGGGRINGLASVIRRVYSLEVTSILV